MEYTLTVDCGCDVNNTALDCDGDGFTNGQEQMDGTDPTDGCSYDSSKQINELFSAAWNNSDCDNDGLNNGDEITNRSDTQNPDSDGDGVDDGTEVHVDSTDPNGSMQFYIVQC